jgi:acyl carrier protein
MTNAEITDAVVRRLAAIAPEVREQTLSPSVSLREQLDLDSMDMLNFVIGLHKELGVEIPEADYARLSSLDQIVTYLAERLAVKP